MKKFFKTAIVLFVVACLFAVASCNGNNPSSESSDGALVNGKAVVKFDANLEETGLLAENVTTARDQSVEPGKTAAPVVLTIKSGANPRNLAFRCWCLDAAGTKPFDFSTPVTKSMTLYAKWESQFVVTYHKDEYVENNITDTKFAGELAERKDDYIGYKKVIGWYTTPDFQANTLYDFSAPISGNLDLYAKTEKGIYIAGYRLAMFEKNYGHEAPRPDQGDQGRDPDDETTVTVKGEGADSYADIHFARCGNVSYIYMTDMNEWMVERNVEGNYLMPTGERFADVMTITYKNLGPSTEVRFYYVVAQSYPHNEERPFLYSGNNVESSNVGQWAQVVKAPVQSNMSRGDEWVTVTINLAEVKDQFSKFSWGEAHMLCIPRIEFTTPSGSWYEDNNVLIKSIEFTPAV